MCVLFPEYGLSNSCDIQNASIEYNLGLTPILIWLQETSSCYLWVSVDTTNVPVGEN